MNAPTMFQAAQRIGRAIRAVHATEGPALKSEDVSFDVSFLFGGQIKGARMRLFMVYTAASVGRSSESKALASNPSASR